MQRKWAYNESVLRSLNVVFCSAAIATAAISCGDKGDANGQDPTNGWENYRLAAEILHDGLTDLFTDPRTKYHLQYSKEEVSRRAELSQSIATKDYLACQESMTRHYAKSLEEILEGNLAPVPPAPDATTFHEVLPLSYYGSQLLAARAYVRSSAGQTDQAVQDLVNALKMIDRLNGRTLLGNMFGNLGANAIYGRLSDNFQALSLRDLSRLKAVVASEIDEAPALVALLKSYQAQFLGQMKMLQTSENLSAELYKEPAQSVFARLAQKSLADRQAIAEAMLDVSNDRFDAMYRALQCPESELWQATLDFREQPQKTGLPANASNQDFAAALVASMSLNLHKCAVVELTRRNQLRLLSLNAELLEYRWHNHRLPSTLADFASELTSFDPLSGETFVYEKHADGTYRLYGKGRPDTGEVDLVYKGARSEMQIPNP